MASIPHDDLESPGLDVQDADVARVVRQGPRQHRPEHRRLGAKDLGPGVNTLVKFYRKIAAISQL